MVRFAYRHLITRLGKSALICASIILTLVVSLLAYNISNQVKDGFISSYKYYDTIIGATGSQTQLVLNTLFHTDRAVGLVPYSVYESIRNDSRVAVAIPFAEGDSYGSARIVGTSIEYLDEFEFESGEGFTETFQAVLGYNVAKSTGMKPNSIFASVHGLSSGINNHSHDKDENMFTVTGVLRKTGTSVDNVILVVIGSVWELHATDSHHNEGDVTAILIKCKSLQYQMALSAEYNNTSGLQAINPSIVLRELMSNIDMTENIVYILCAVILAMNFMVICVITALTMYDVKKDVVLFRLIGISRRRIGMIISLQYGLLLCVAVCISFIASRLGVYAVSSYAATLGVVLTPSKFYGEELILILVVLFAVIVPTCVSIMLMFRKDVINED